MVDKTIFYVYRNFVPSNMDFMNILLYFCKSVFRLWSLDKRENTIVPIRTVNSSGRKTIIHYMRMELWQIGFNQSSS